MDDCDQSQDFNIDIDYDIEVKKELLDEDIQRFFNIKKFLEEQKNEKPDLTHVTDLDGSFITSRSREDLNEDYSNNCSSQNHQPKKENGKNSEADISHTNSCLDSVTFDPLVRENGGNTFTVDEDLSLNNSQLYDVIDLDPCQTPEEADSDLDSSFYEQEDTPIMKFSHVSNKSSISQVSNPRRPVIRKGKKTKSKRKLVDCTVCDYSCSSESRLLRHMRTHTEERNYLCSICDAKYTQSADLQVHLRSHTGEKPFHCQFCDYKATKNNRLQRHLKTHTGDKPHQCSICDYSCIEAADLRAHMFKHSGAKPFICEICDFRAAKSSDLVKHIRIHTGEKPYKCLLCDYRCNRAYHLKIHMERRHTKSSKIKK